MRLAKLSSTGQPSISRLDTVAECLMVALLAFAPFAFGTVDAWSEQVVVLLAGAMAACLALKCLLARPDGFTWSWMYLPLGLFLVLISVQLMPLPAGLLAVISPKTADLKRQLLSDLPGSQEQLRTMSVSLYPLATERALRLALCVAAVFTVAVNVYRRGEQVKRLLWAVTMVAATMVMLALAQNITNSDKIYWLVPTGGDIARGGAFLNRNNYCQFMNLSMGAALGLLMIRLAEEFRGRSLSLPGALNLLGDDKLRSSWFLLGVIVLAMATVFLSLSRAGMISLLIAWGLASFMLALIRRLDPWGWLMGAIAVVALVSVLYIGFDAIYDRLASLAQGDAYRERWQLAKETASAWATFPLLGSGLGTYEFVHPMFDGSDNVALALHAENEYVQILAETGLLGTVMVAAFLAGVVWACLRCLRRRMPEVRWAAVGLTTGLVAVAIHSFTDFGQRLPANACLTAAMCGLLVSMARKDWPKMVPRREPGRQAVPIRIGAGLCLVVVIGLATWAAMGSDASRRAEIHWHAAQRIDRQICAQNGPVSDADHGAAIAEMQRASQIEPANVLYRYQLGLYRWRSISRFVEEVTGSVFLADDALGHVGAITDDLDRSRALCPTFGPTYALAGQLKWSVLGQPEGAGLIRNACRLAPCDPLSHFAKGLLDAHEGRMRDSIVSFRRALLLQPSLCKAAANVYIYQVDRPDLAVDVARDNIWALIKIAGELQQNESHAVLASQARELAMDALRERCDREETDASELAYLADAYLSRRQYIQAGKYYRRALAKDCTQASWRLNFARALGGNGQNSQAIEQAYLCLELRPQMTAAKSLIRELRACQSVVTSN